MKILFEPSLDRALEIVKASGYEVTPLTLEVKLQRFREKHGQGSGKEYWHGLAKVAEEHFKI